MSSISQTVCESPASPPLYAPPLGRLQCWVFSHKKVVLTQNGDNFYYQLFDRVTKNHEKKKKISFGKDTHTTEERAQHLVVKSYPQINPAGKVEFIVPFVCQQKQIQGLSVKILLVKKQQKKSLVWQIVDHLSKSYYYAFSTISVTQQASISTRRFFNEISSRSTEDIISSLSKEFMEIAFVGHVLDPKNVNLAEFRLRPKAFQSRIDNRVPITRMTWVVVMVAYTGTHKLGTSCDQNHAQTIVEGVADTGQFALMFHHDKGGVEVKDLTHKKIKYYERTTLWKVSARKAEQMIKAARNNELKRDVPFNMFGPYSVINHLTCKKKGESCFTYTRRMLKMVDVNLEFDPTYFIVPRTRDFTKKPGKFKKLTDSCNAPHAL